MNNRLLCAPAYAAVLLLSPAAHADLTMTGVLHLSGSAIQNQVKTMGKQDRAMMESMAAAMPEIGLVLGRPMTITAYANARYERSDTASAETINDYTEKKTIQIARMDKTYTISPLGADDSADVKPGASNATLGNVTIVDTHQIKRIVGHPAHHYIIRGISGPKNAIASINLWLATDLPALRSFSMGKNMPKLSPAQMDQIAKLKGLCLEFTASAVTKDGTVNFDYHATSVSAKALPDYIFAIPAGYAKAPDQSAPKTAGDSAPANETLSDAAAAGHLDRVTELVNAGADVNAVDENGATPLINAAVSGNTEVVKLLLAHGAKKDIKDLAGKTALDLATEAHHPEIAALLSAPAKN